MLKSLAIDARKSADAANRAAENLILARAALYAAAGAATDAAADLVAARAAYAAADLVAAKAALAAADAALAAAKFADSLS